MAGSINRRSIKRSRLYHSLSDGTFLGNDPLKLLGFWIPLDDATLANGCLWFAPGSHRHPVTRRMTRTPDDLVPEKGILTFSGEDPAVEDEAYVPAPVQSGSLVLIDGRVMHKSAANKSDKPRHAYTFHIVENAQPHRYLTDNWLQPTKQLPFPSLYDN